MPACDTTSSQRHFPFKQIYFRRIGFFVVFPLFNLESQRILMLGFPGTFILNFKFTNFRHLHCAVSIKC